jgi:hypothetical protein
MCARPPPVPVAAKWVDRKMEGENDANKKIFGKFFVRLNPDRGALVSVVELPIKPRLIII